MSGFSRIVGVSTRLLREGRVGRALRGFFHPTADRELAWDVKQTAKLRDRLDDVEDLGS